MERKGSSSTVQGTATLTAEEVRAALPGTAGHTKTLTPALTSDEEKVLRMRYGGKQQDLHAPLPRAAGGNAELADELLVIEMQLMKAHRMQMLKAKGSGSSTARAPVAVARPALDPAGAKAKDKIVRALRKKK